MSKTKCISTLILSILGVVFFTVNASAQQERPKPKTPVELAASQTERFSRILKLKDYQIFLMDSVLQFNFAALETELKQAQQSSINSPEAMQMITEKWAVKTDSAFVKFLDKTQYEKYLKSVKRDRKR